MLAAHRRFVALLLVGFAWLCAAPFPAAAQPERPKCGVFFNKATASDVPPDMMAVVEAGHEVIAAQDCVATGKAATACGHWKLALNALDHGDPNLAREISTGIKAMMQQSRCPS